MMEILNSLEKLRKIYNTLTNMGKRDVTQEFSLRCQLRKMNNHIKVYKLPIFQLLKFLKRNVLYYYSNVFIF